MAWYDHQELISHSHRSERYKRTFWSEYTHVELVEEFKRSKNKSEWFQSPDYFKDLSDDELLAEFINIDKTRRKIKRIKEQQKILSEISILQDKLKWYDEHVHDFD